MSIYLCEERDKPGPEFVFFFYFFQFWLCLVTVVMKLQYSFVFKFFFNEPRCRSLKTGWSCNFYCLKASSEMWGQNVLEPKYFMIQPLLIWNIIDKSLRTFRVDSFLWIYNFNVFFTCINAHDKSKNLNLGKLCKPKIIVRKALRSWHLLVQS